MLFYYLRSASLESAKKTVYICYYIHKFLNDIGYTSLITKEFVDSGAIFEFLIDRNQLQYSIKEAFTRMADILVLLPATCKGLDEIYQEVFANQMLLSNKESIIINQELYNLSRQPCVLKNKRTIEEVQQSDFQTRFKEIYKPLERVTII